MYSSIFSYNLTRSFPYPWFSWVVILGGVGATSILTILNLAANGYELHAVYVSDPNATLSTEHEAWYEKRPWSWTAKTAPACQAQTLSRGSQLSTTNFGYEYTIESFDAPTRLWGESLEYHFINDAAYLNDNLQNCTLDKLNFQWTIEDAGIGEMNMTIQCKIYNGTLPILVALTPKFQPVHVSYVTAPYQSNQAISVGNSIASWYIQNRMNHSFLGDFYNGLKVEVSYGPALFPVSYQESRPVGLVSFNKVGSNPVSVTIVAASQADWSSSFGRDLVAKNMISTDFAQDAWAVNISDPYIDLALYVDGFAKSILSAVLRDLGQSGGTDIFASPQLTMDFINKTIQLKYGQGWSDIGHWNDVVPDSSYSYHTSPLANATLAREWTEVFLPPVLPTTFAMQYLCQASKLKPPGSLFVSIAVADFVFLSIIWSIFSWIVAHFAERKHVETQYCVGCAKAVAMGQLDLDDGRPTPAANAKHKYRSQLNTVHGKVAVSPELLPISWSNSISDRPNVIDRQPTSPSQTPALIWSDNISNQTSADAVYNTCDAQRRDKTNSCFLLADV